jgi:hypothetical protein
MSAQVNAGFSRIECVDQPVEPAMERANFEKSLNAFVQRRPFKPFRVELVSGTRLTVDHPEALAHRGAVAVFVDARGDYTLFESTGVAQITEATGNGSIRSRNLGYSRPD